MQKYFIMTEISNTENNNPDFMQIIPIHSDEEILKILQNRKHYQKEAADLAILEAIKRGLINSEQDLFSDRFKEKPIRFTFFPNIENDTARNRIRKSIARSMVIIGGLPLVWGVVKFYELQNLESAILILLGALWIFTSKQLIRSVETKWITILLLMFVGSIIYLGNILVSLSQLSFMDNLVPVIVFGFVLYGILFLVKLKK